MKRTLLLGLLSLALTALCFLTGGADPVEHHGYFVSPEASHSECLSCHDGAIARSVSVCAYGSCTVGNSHPVDREYPPPGKERRYQPLFAARAAGIRFIDGRISCVSCHDLTNTARYHPALPSRASALCRTCHLK